MTLEAKPLVTIGMPVYNGAGHLRESIDSLLAQTIRDFEILISDNASTDATDKICEEYAKKDNRVRFVRQKENIGAIPNFEFLKQNAHGKYFIWAAHDDKWDSHFLEKCVRLLESDPSLVVAMSSFDRYDPESGIAEHYRIEDSLPSEKNLYGRLKQHILFYLNDGKGVPIYSVWRTAMIADVPLRRDWSYFPVRFIFESLFRGGAGLVLETLFFKRAPLSRTEISSASGGSAFGGKYRYMDTSRLWRTLWDRVKKLFGSLFPENIYVIIHSTQLAPWEKTRLVFWQCVVALRLFTAKKT